MISLHFSNYSIPKCHLGLSGINQQNKAVKKFKPHAKYIKEKEF